MKDNSLYNKFWDEISESDEGKIINNIAYLKSQNRSSTIFPIFKNTSNKTHTKIVFLSYWLKKHGNNVIASLTIRDLKGNEIYKFFKIIVEFKSYTFIVSDFIKGIQNNFCGSVEIEIFSKNKPLYTFPAITVSFSNNSSSSLVHSCIRTYNQDENNSDYALNYPQTGFDVDFKEGNKNFIYFCGGSIKEYKINIKLKEGNLVKHYTRIIKNERYGQSHILFLEEIISIYDIKKFNKPKCSINHDLKDVFPRFYVGICHEFFAPTLTHTFFDTSLAEEYHCNNPNIDNLRVKNTMSNNLFDAAFSVPIYPINKFDTILKSYAQNITFTGKAIAFLYNCNGTLLFSRQLTEQEMIKLNDLSEINLGQFVIDAGIELNNLYSLRIGFIDINSPFPKRFKLGLNVRRRNANYGTNICFAPTVFSENILSKPFTRRWFPIGGPEKYIASIHNTVFNRFKCDEITKLTLEFVNHEGETIVRFFETQNNATLFIDENIDKSLINLLGDKGGWCMATSHSYLCDAYYFSMTKNQIGGDHAF